jgi:hypothetical protein
MEGLGSCHATKDCLAVVWLSEAEKELRDYKTWPQTFRKFDGVLYGQKWADPALMRIRLNIVR